MRLSDCFMKPDREEGEPCLECKATVLNINAGRNNDMMLKCKRLRDYAYFIGQIRWKMDEGWSLEEATEISIKRCIDRGVLTDILTKYGTEVCGMILTEYDEQEEREYQRKEGRAEGRAAGLVEGRAEGLAEGRAKGRAEGLAEGRSEGRSEGRTEILRELLFDRLEKMSSIPQDVMERIMSVPNEETLKKWYTLADGVETIDEFTEKM